MSPRRPDRYRHEHRWSAWLAWFRAGGKLRWLVARWWQRDRRDDD